MNGKKFNSERAPQAVGLYPHARKVGEFLFLSGVGFLLKENQQAIKRALPLDSTTFS